MNLVSSSMQGADFVYLYEKTTVGELTQKVSEFFVRERYKLENGTGQNGVYGTGDGFLRILFGAFVKRYKFIINIGEQDGRVRLAVRKAMTGFSGGLIGNSNMNTEFARITNNIRVTLQ